MTGLEGAAAAASLVGRELAKGGSGADAALSDIARETPEMQRAARLHAENVLARKVIINRVLAPIGAFLSKAQPYFKRDFQEDLAKRTVFIPEEEIVEPLASVAVPAIQGLTCSVDEEVLREMYLQLLATATDGRDREGAHPAYAAIIKELSQPEAVMLHPILAGAAFPVVRVVDSLEDGSRTVLSSHILLMVDDETGALSTEPFPSHYVDNWSRLGLVEVDYLYGLADDSFYARASCAREVIDARDLLHGQDGHKIAIDRGMLKPTTFGIAFAKAVGIRARGKGDQNDA